METDSTVRTVSPDTTRTRVLVVTRRSAEEEAPLPFPSWTQTGTRLTDYLELRNWGRDYNTRIRTVNALQPEAAPYVAPFLNYDIYTQENTKPRWIYHVNGNTDCLNRDS